MILRGIDFGNVLGASGVQGNFGEGYLFHKPLKAVGLLDFTGMTLVTKTTSLLSRRGNMPLTRNYTPKELFPACIKVKLLKKAMLNSVSLSGPGIGALLGLGIWQEMTKAFMISIMAVGDSKEKRLEEIRIMRDMIAYCMDEFNVRFGIQQNYSCPNLKNLKPSQAIDESEKGAEILSSLGLPIMQKFSIASATPEVIMELNENPHVDAICVSNTIPFGWPGIDWKKAWGSDISPLEKFGGGGLSGPALLELVCQWIQDLRDLGFTKPINGGGGIMCPADVDDYHTAGASSIFLGTIASMRPHNVQPTIMYANSLDWT
jgi:dihydroorotate dehydrogenase